MAGRRFLTQREKRTSRRLAELENGQGGIEYAREHAHDYAHEHDWGEEDAAGGPLKNLERLLARAEGPSHARNLVAYSRGDSWSDSRSEPGTTKGVGFSTAPDGALQRRVFGVILAG